MARQTKAFFVDGQIHYQLGQTEKATIAVVSTGLYSASGTAKKDNIDDHDPNIGVNVALSRALDSLSNKLLKDANGLLKAQEEKARVKVVNKILAAEKVSDQGKGLMQKIMESFRSSLEGMASR